MRVPAKRSRRTYNLRRIKATYPYSIPEAAALLGVHKNAVIQWGKQGLTIDRSGRPHLVRGSDLQRFLETRQRSRRHRCRAEEFYCFKCRAPREAALGIADLAMLSPTRMRLSAICAVCESRINKVQAVRDLPKVAKTFHLQELRGRHLIERAEPSVRRVLEALGPDTGKSAAQSAQKEASRDETLKARAIQSPQ